MRTGESGELFRELLVPFAASVGLDFNVEIMRPGNTPVQVAFTFVICGAQLLVCYTEPDAVPIISKKTSKRVAKAMRRSFGTPEARDAAVFLAQAFAVDRFEKSRRHGEEADADPSFRQLIQDHFPLSDELAAQLDAITAEYGTIGTRQVGDEVRPRTESTGGYSRSHKASERNSDEDEDRGDTEPR